MLKLIILFVFVTTTLADYSTQRIKWWDLDDNKEYAEGIKKTIPFPQCLISGSKSKYLESSHVQNLFDKALREEEQSATYERYENSKKDNYDVMDYNARQSKYDNGKSLSVAAAAMRLTRIIMTKLACDLNGTDADNLNKFLHQFAVPEKFCTFREKPDCTGLIGYRTPTGLCNNLEHPYEGNSQTAFGRLLPAVYSDYISEPRRKSVYGGLLPGCRKISLALGSKPIFDRKFNNFFAAFGQFIGHDIALSTPVTDTYLTPITSCTCDSKRDWNKCTVIDVAPDDPYLRGQKCMAFPATAQAFKDQICTLGVKEQLNGNTHFIDLSGIYGSTARVAELLRGDHGLLKSSRRAWFKYELPPGQREGRSCVDSTTEEKCFAGGDSRLMIDLLFTGIQAIFLRAHNIIAKSIFALQPQWVDDEIYQETRRIITAYFQRIVYKEWLPILFGDDAYEEYFGSKAAETRTQYDKTVKPVVFNEIASAAFRLHTLCRDLFSRCTPDGKRIDQLWLNDILQRAKYAYDIDNNGLDSILCGSFYDYGFAHDGNFAHQIRNRFFESISNYGKIWRNDLVSINICRGREHGIPSYNKFRQYCNLTKAYYFEDFGDTINYEGIKLLQRLYKHVDDVDLFVALNLEDPVPGGLVGRVSICLIGYQFQVLRNGDRLFYSHPESLLPQNFFDGISTYPFHCFICNTVDIKEVPKNPFVTPNEDNPLVDCSTCPPLNVETLVKWNTPATS